MHQNNGWGMRPWLHAIKVHRRSATTYCTMKLILPPRLRQKFLVPESMHPRPRTIHRPTPDNLGVPLCLPGHDRDVAGRTTASLQAVLPVTRTVRPRNVRPNSSSTHFRYIARGGESVINASSMRTTHQR